MILVLVLLQFCNFLPASTLYLKNRFPEANEFLGAKNLSRINTHRSELSADNAQEALVRSEDPVLIKTLPVGQGDATIIECPQSTGHQFSLIDMGSTSATGAMDRTTYVSYIKTFLFGNGYRLRHIFLTHPDSDHFNYGYDNGNGLFPELVRKYQVTGEKVTIHFSSWANWVAYAEANDKPTLNNFLYYLYDNRNAFIFEDYDPNAENIINICDYYAAGEGEEDEEEYFSSDVKLMIIAAELGPFKNANEMSLVMSLSHAGDDYNGGKMLFMGDFSGVTQYLLLLKNKKYRQYLEADVVMVPHHGSDTFGNANPLFYEVVNARHAIISSHIDYTHNHPKLKTLASICDGFYIKEEEPYYPYGLCDVNKDCSDSDKAQGHSSDSSTYHFNNPNDIGKELVNVDEDSGFQAGCRTKIHQTTKKENNMLKAYIVVTTMYDNKEPTVKSQPWG